MISRIEIILRTSRNMLRTVVDVGDLGGTKIQD